MKVKIILHIFESKPDTYGNIRYAFRVIKTSNRKVVEAEADHDSNVLSAIDKMGIKSEEVYVATSKLPIRRFDSFIKSLPYAGCSSKDVAEFIKKGLRRRS